MEIVGAIQQHWGTCCLVSGTMDVG